ncbi:hypothetical protein LTR66_013898 [Elasticomyces elasticus]|nr:hypothetical protein LTR66_013898 [Elasticomyces elasticus]
MISDWYKEPRPGRGSASVPAVSHSEHLVEMEQTPIKDLAPSLLLLDTKVIKAIVDTIWPYSPSDGTAALLLTEEDGSLRVKDQLAVHLSGPSLQALMRTGVRVSDEVRLALWGARWGRAGTERMTEKAVDWELVYTDRLAIQITRSSGEVLIVDVDHSSPSPKRQTRMPLPRFDLQAENGMSRPAASGLVDGTFVQNIRSSPSSSKCKRPPSKKTDLHLTSKEAEEDTRNADMAEAQLLQDHIGERGEAGPCVFVAYSK